MRVLVTGASGHIGGVVSAQLLDGGHEVIGVSRRLNRRARSVSRALSLDLGSAEAAATIDAAAGRCDAVVHAAAAIDMSPFAPELSLANGLGTQQLLELARRWEVESFVYLSSLPVIGRPRTLPVTESHPIDPPTAYHASKLYGEHLVRVAGVAGASLRLTAPIGSGMARQRVLPTFVRRALDGQPLEVAGEGSRGQDYVDARDIAAAVQAAIERRADGLLNIASGRCVTNLELARICVEVLGSASAVRLSGAPDPEDGVRWEVSVARAEETIGYRPAIRLEDSIAALADELRGEEGDG